jgi:hypothetical protein
MTDFQDAHKEGFKSAASFTGRHVIGREVAAPGLTLSLTKGSGRSSAAGCNFALGTPFILALKENLGEAAVIASGALISIGPVADPKL